MSSGEGHDQGDADGLGRVHRIELEEVGDVDLMALLDEVTVQLEEAPMATPRPRAALEESSRSRLQTTLTGSRVRVDTAPGARADGAGEGRVPIRGKPVDESFKVRELERRLSEATSETEGWRKRMG